MRFALALFYTLLLQLNNRKSCSRGSFIKRRPPRFEKYDRVWCGWSHGCTGYTVYECWSMRTPTIILSLWFSPTQHSTYVTFIYRPYMNKRFEYFVLSRIGSISPVSERALVIIKRVFSLRSSFPDSQITRVPYKWQHLQLQVRNIRLLDRLDHSLLVSLFMGEKPLLLVKTEDRF